MSKVIRKLRRVARGALPGNAPDFLIIGAQKAGTTTLHHWLAQHPDLEGSTPKELQFFNQGIHQGQNVEDYQRNFKALGRRRKLFFESTPEYIYHPGTAAAIAETYPDIKLIVLLREPVARAFSAWIMYDRLIRENRLTADGYGSFRPLEGNLLFEHFVKGRDHMPGFRECLEIELALMDTGEGFEPALIRRGFYWAQLQNYYAHFPAEQICVLGMGELRDTPDHVLRKVCEFLGQPSPMAGTIDINTRRNVGDHRTRIAPADAAFLEDLYAGPNAELFKNIGKLNW